MSMRYLMRQRIFAIGDDFTIKDETGQDRFIVDGKVFTLGHKLIITDLAGNELATIQQRLLTLLPAYEITRGGHDVAEVRKQLTIFRDRFTVDIPGPDDLEVQGDIWDHEYSFIRGEQEVARVSKQWFSLQDTYGVEVLPG